MTDDEVIEIARRVADRLVEAAPATGVRLNLGSGDPGIALALLYASEVLEDERYLKAGRMVLRRAAEATAADPLKSAGLFTGTAGFMWVMTEFARREPRYLPSLRSLAERLGEQASPSAARDGVAFGEYDAISGVAGRLAAVLRVSETAGVACDDAADRLVAYLLDVTAVADDGAPNWYCPPRLYPGAAPWFHDLFPHGMYNLGFAHGLPGMLAALTLAAAAGIGGGGRGGGGQVADRVGELARWLADVRLDDVRGPSWAGALQADPDSRLPVRDADQIPARTAWCYGAPGVAAALFSASAISGDTGSRDLAVAALKRVQETPHAERHAFAPTVCHGLAGLLAVYTRAHAQTGEPGFQKMRDDTRAQLCLLAADEHPYVFADEPQPDSLSHDAGLIEGAAGVLLALLGTLSPEASRWDEVLFLTPSDLGAT